MLGPVNHIYDELNKVWVNSEQWLDAINVKKVDYHGGQFEGNECRAILKNIQVLRELCPPQFSQFVAVFDTFNDVVHSCYGSQLLPSFELNISGQNEQDHFKCRRVVIDARHLQLGYL